MRAGCWWRLLRNNRWQVDWDRVSIVLGVSAITPLNDALALAQRAIFDRRIRTTAIQHPPVFIIGHWRSGTTLMHELLVEDPQFAFPNTFQCFAPSHFLLSEYLMVRLGGFLLPKRRPMDNMRAGWDLPQEDEFALMNLGVPSPYLRIAFPQTQDTYLQYLDMQGLNEDELARWKTTFHWFLQAITYRYGGKRLILKSPTHTGRLGLLASMYPGAKFIHMVRDPEKLYHSTKRLWRSLEQVQALHGSADEERTSDYVLTCLRRMYAQFEKDRHTIDARRIMDVRYEDLAADPYNTIRHVYRSLDLGDFSEVAPRLAQRLASHRAYRPNQHPTDPLDAQRIFHHWHHYAAKYGYVHRGLESVEVAQ